MFSKSLFLLIFVNCVFGANVPCQIHPQNPVVCSLPTDGSIPTIKVTVENEPITVTGQHPGGLDSLQILQFAAPHKLQYIPTKVFEKLKNLQSFQAKGVQLSTLTTNAFSNCLQLQSIALFENNFPNIPASFAESCSSLKSLMIANNNIKTIHKDAFKGLKNLDYLHLQNNEIASLDPLTLTYTPNLRKIQIQSSLSSIHPDLFAALSPRDVRIFSNRLNSLPAIRFASVVNLQAFYLAGNQIKAIDKNFFLDYVQFGKNYLIDLQQNICVNKVFNDTTKIDLLNDPQLKVCFANSNNRDCRFYLDHERNYVCVLENVDLVISSIGGQHITYE
jgi:Leucine-rich repeat (LRR) protein